MNNLTVVPEREIVFSDLYDIYEMVTRQIIIPSIDEGAVLSLYLDSAIGSLSIPDIENIASRIDDENSSTIYETCFILGLTEVEVDFMMGKYCHEIAADLDVSIQRVLDRYNFSYICDGEVALGENVLPCQNILFSKWNT